MIGLKIKKYLNDNGIKQSYLAKKMGMPISTFSYMLNDKRKIEIDEYFKICSILNVSIETFRDKPTNDLIKLEEEPKGA